jgi:hypothetical protein
MLQIDIVVKSVFDGRTGGELGIRPESEDGCGHDMGARMADAFEFSHFVALVESFAFRRLDIGLHGEISLTAKIAKIAEKRETHV